jgi:hypothetical protein
VRVVKSWMLSLEGWKISAEPELPEVLKKCIFCIKPEGWLHN